MLHLLILQEIKMRINHKWSALAISMFVIFILSLIMVYFLEFIVPASKNVKWIDNWTVAYYQALAWVEAALLDMSNTSPWVSVNKNNWSIDVKWYEAVVTAASSTIPIQWEWNSYYNSNWNRLWPWEPLQLLIWPSNDWNTWVWIYFKVPEVWVGLPNLTLSWWATYPVINWILTSKTWAALYASWSQFMATEIASWAFFTASPLYLWPRAWMDLDKVPSNFKNFYDSLICPSLWCTLKLSLINRIESQSSKTLPYIEYRITWLDSWTPLQYAIINSDWFSYWFKRHVKREVQIITTNEALDFTIFQ